MEAQLKYVVCPGMVTSRTDGQRHYIDANQLMMLYGVDSRECSIHKPEYWWTPLQYTEAEKRIGGLTPLVPRYDGDYVLPASGQEPAPRLITHVAIQHDGKTYSLPKPNRHHHVIRLIAAENGIGVYGPSVEGFIDNTGVFLSRRGAMALARDTGQLNRKKGSEYYQGDELYSEDLW